MEVFLVGCRHSSKIAIIGAGLAGLTIAHRLRQKNYDVEIYEARPRIGGRILTALIKNFDGEYSLAELGGQNLADGGDASHILSLAKELNVEVQQDTYPFTRAFFDGQIFHDHSSLIASMPFSRDNLEARLMNLQSPSNLCRKS